VQPWLWLTDDNGTFTYSGQVRDEATRTSIIDALRTHFGSDKTKGAITVDPNVSSAPWTANLGAALDNLKVNGLQALFSGNSVNIGGLASDADRDRMIGTLRSALGGGLTFGSLADKVGDLVSGATGSASLALTALKTNFSAGDVVGALNLSIINFTTGSAEIPGASTALLREAAAKIRQLPAGTVIEVGGHTDNTGDAAANVALSQQRAEAVRNALIQAGVDPSMLVAKGYGGAAPVSSNDTADGRFRNRRIEYRVVKTA
jgi:OOP family OmpA-OmpF porin